MKLSPKQKEVVLLMRSTHPRMSYFYHSGNRVHCHVYPEHYGTPSIKVHYGACKALIRESLMEQKSGDYYLTKLGKTISL